MDEGLLQVLPAQHGAERKGLRHAELSPDGVHAPRVCAQAAAQAFWWLLWVGTGSSYGMSLARVRATVCAGAWRTGNPENPCARAGGRAGG